MAVDGQFEKILRRLDGIQRRNQFCHSGKWQIIVIAVGMHSPKEIFCSFDINKPLHRLHFRNEHECKFHRSRG